MRVAVFDVNETLLDLTPMRRHLEQVVGFPDAASTWFSELLRLSFVSSAIDRYVPLPDLARHALIQVAHRHGATLDTEGIDTVVDAMRHLPAHPDVTPGLDSLAEAGYTIAALTNSPRGMAIDQLTNAGIRDRFAAIMSVDMVQRFKPHRSVYEAAARALTVETTELILVAAHDWDVAGAMAAGCAGVFVARNGATWSPAFERPSTTVSDMSEAASWIVETDR